MLTVQNACKFLRRHREYLDNLLFGLSLFVTLTWADIIIPQGMPSSVDVSEDIYIYISGVIIISSGNYHFSPNQRPVLLLCLYPPRLIFRQEILLSLGLAGELGTK